METTTTYVTADGSTITTVTRELLTRVVLGGDPVRPASKTTVIVRNADGRTVIDEYTNWVDCRTGRLVRQALTGAGR
jgi:hypothetical protein